GTYYVQAGDSLQSVALNEFGDSSLWYLIADANGLSSGPADLLTTGQRLSIPNVGTTSVHNNSQTNQPYSQAKIIGDLTPGRRGSAPPPPPKCDGVWGDLAQAIVQVIAAVASIVATAFGFGELAPLISYAGSVLGDLAKQGVNLADGAQ